MFAKWTVDSVKRRANMRTGLVTKLKASAAQLMPRFPEIEDLIFPKKCPVIIHYLADHTCLYSVNGGPVLVELGDGLVFPFLKIAIEYPGLLRRVFCYDEAVVAVLRGASLMARGTWGTDATYHPGEIVELCLAGETVPFAVGVLEISGEEIAARPDGVAVSVLHVLRDGLWDAKSL
jgi:predicted RNA-binding protein (TIGR00451 family)